MPPRAVLSKAIVYEEALITSIVRYGEADCIVRMLCQERGRRGAFFKQGLAFKKGKGAIQAPMFARVGLIEHPHKLATMVSCDGDPSHIMPCSLKVFAYQAYVAELIEKLLPEAEAAPEIFALAQEVHEALLAHGSQPCILRAFELKLLDYCGYLPELPQESPIVAFDPLNQRFLLEYQEGSLLFSNDAARLARAMLIAKVGSISYEGTELMMIGRIFHNRLKLMGLLPLKSVEFLKQLSGRT